ncbi:MAG: aerobic carbon-monoxide dehydrogenase medium subunit, partial [Mycobacteriales bacterium]
CRMIPASFDYVRPSTVDDAVAALAAAGEDAKVLAGGQSLLPLLRLRLAYPSTLVDIGRVDGLRGVRRDGDQLVIGALTTHHDIVHDPVIREHCPVLAQATATVADPAVRHRGTFGGSLAHADPAGDLPAVALALDAELVIAGSGGRRSVPAAEFFSDYLETAIGPGEVLVEVRVPVLGAGWGSHYEKFNRVAQAWAIVGVAALVRLDGDRIAEARVGLTNMGPTPLRASATEAALVGVAAANGAVAAASEQAADDTEPSADLSAQPDYRRHLARVLTRRAVQRAAAAAG